MEVFHFGGWTGGWLSSFYLFPKLGNYLNRKKNQLRTVYQIYYLIILINRCFKDKLREGVKKSEKKVNLPSFSYETEHSVFILFGRRAGTKWKLFHVWEHKIEYEPHYTLYGFMGKLDCLVVTILETIVEI